MRPADVLVAATHHGAQALGLENEVGVIARGKQADLLAVTGDPTTDIRTLKNARLVLQGGRIVRDGNVPAR